jgi:4-carboxymuconolactone decarboxylase
MDDRKRLERGMAVRRAVLGDGYVDRAVASTTELTRDFQDFITRYAWGEVWTRPGLDLRTRRVLALGTLLALGRWNEFRLHVRAALGEDGLPVDVLKEIVLQQAVYCGVPAANAALEVVREVVDGLK